MEVVNINVFKLEFRNCELYLFRIYLPNIIRYIYNGGKNVKREAL